MVREDSFTTYLILFGVFLTVGILVRFQSSLIKKINEVEALAVDIQLKSSTYVKLQLSAFAKQVTESKQREPSHQLRAPFKKIMALESLVVELKTILSALVKYQENHQTMEIPKDIQTLLFETVITSESLIIDMKNLFMERQKPG